MRLDRRHVLLAACASLVAGSAEAQNRAELLKTLLDLEVESWGFTKNHDLPAMDAYLADEAVLIFADGSRFTKPEFLQFLPRFRLTSFDVDRQSAELRVASAEVASLLYRVRYSQPKSVAVIASNTYVFRQGKWRSLLYQETKSR